MYPQNQRDMVLNVLFFHVVHVFLDSWQGVGGSWQKKSVSYIFYCSLQLQCQNIIIFYSLVELFIQVAEVLVMYQEEDHVLMSPVL